MRTYLQQTCAVALLQIILQPQQGRFDKLPQLGLVLQLILGTRQLHHELKIGQGNKYLFLLPFHPIYLHEFLQDKFQLVLPDVAGLVQTLHVIKVAFVIIGGGNTLHVRITGGTAYFLNVIDKRAGRHHVVNTVDVADVHSHAESFCSNNHPLRALFKVPDDGSLLRLVLLAVVRSHQTPVGRSHPGLDTHIYATGKRIVKQRLMPVEKLLHTPGYDALLAFVISLSLFQCEPADVKTDVLASDRTYIKYARFHLQGADGIEYHIVAAFGIPHGSGGKGKQGERITEVLFQCAQITPQKPIVHAELFAPGGYRMRLIDNNHTDAAVADKMSDVVGEQQLW